MSQQPCYRSKVILPGNDEIGRVEATHNSAVRVLCLSGSKCSRQLPDVGAVGLRLIKGETMDIEGVFVC
jgi:hypothetical protein